jgi:hypothetical protein
MAPRLRKVSLSLKSLRRASPSQRANFGAASENIRASALGAPSGTLAEEAE